jgi:prepilin-type processing-associated H-X9-DG protein
VVVVALLLVTTGALILPAIDGSRFQARLDSCQDGLRQFGLALTQYGQHQGGALMRLASNGRLTPAGVFAAGLLRDRHLTDSRRIVCPDAWLAAQGEKMGTGTSPGGTQADNWPGTWRDGTTAGWRSPPSPAGVPLLADAPSADLPGQSFSSHGGRGRNVLFEDGHLSFVPTVARRDAADWFRPSGEGSAAAGISAPIVFVGGR